MKRMFKSHVFIGLLSIALGLAVSFVLTPMYSRAIEKKDKVVRLKRTVPAGNKIEDKDLELIEIGVYNLSDNIIRSKEKVSGKYAKSALYAGMYPVEEALSETPLQTDLYLNGIPEDKYAVSVTVQNYAAGLSSKLLQGDIVSLVIKRQSADGSIICEIPDTLMYMEVLSATQESGSDKSQLSDRKDEKNASNDRLATVTLLANKHQVTELTSYEGDAVIHIALKNRSDETMKLKLLSIQEEYFRELEAAEYANTEEEEEQPDTNEGASLPKDTETEHKEE